MKVKTIIAAAVAALTLTAAPAAQAADIAWTPNNSGGRIVLQSILCPTDAAKRAGIRQMYNTTSTGAAEYGCWYFDQVSMTIHGYWSGGQRVAYNAHGFTFFDPAKN